MISPLSLPLGFGSYLPGKKFRNLMRSSGFGNSKLDLGYNIKTSA